MTTTVIVQARMGSTRLPGKVLMRIANRPMLSYQLERLKWARRVQQIIVATTTLSRDDAIVDLCRSEGIESFRGSEQDVLSRYAAAAARFGATTVVRVTADCPLIDPDLVDEAIDTFEREEDVDFVSNMLRPTWPLGMAVEVFSHDVLMMADREARQPHEREHVTPFIYQRPNRFRLRSIERSPDLSSHRWTVDTPEDFELVSRIIGELIPSNPRFKLQDVLAVLERHPDWIRINAHIAQKSLVRDEELS